MATTAERYLREHPRSAELHRRALDTFPDGVTHDIRRMAPFPLYVERASGGRKWDVDGHEVVDFVMGHGALLFGHVHPDITAEVLRQAIHGTHYGAGHLKEIEWGELVRQLVPCAERVRFVSSGTEAAQMAVRLARASTGRRKLVQFAGHFHGWSDTVFGRPEAAPGLTPAAFEDRIILPQDDVDALASVFREEGRDIAALILEPSGASWGTVPSDPAWVGACRELTAEAGALLIFDEVVTGFRLARGGAQEAYGVRPDLTTLAKVLAGGLPGGAVAGRTDVLACLETAREEHGLARVPHPGTFNANPLSAAAGVTALTLVRDTDAVTRAARTAQRLCDGWNRVFEETGTAGCCYGEASLLHLAVGCGPLVRPLPGTIRFPPQNGAQAYPPRASAVLEMALRRAMLNEGVDLMHTGAIVSAVHTERDVGDAVQALGRALTALRAEGTLS